MGATTAIDLAGLPETRRLLRRFEPDLLKRLDAKMSAAPRRDLRPAPRRNFSPTGAGGNAYRIITRNRIDGFSKSVTTVARQRRARAEVVELARRPGRHLRARGGAARRAAAERAARALAHRDAERAVRRPGPLPLGGVGRRRGRSTRRRSTAEIQAVEAEYTARLRA